MELKPLELYTAVEQYLKLHVELLGLSAVHLEREKVLMGTVLTSRGSTSRNSARLPCEKPESLVWPCRGRHELRMISILQPLSTTKGKTTELVPPRGRPLLQFRRCQPSCLTYGEENSEAMFAKVTAF